MPELKKSAHCNFMINRVLLRIKIVQILYSYYKNGSKSIPLAEKELFHSIERTYDLYFYLLQLSIEITRYASSKIEGKRNKLRPTDEDLNPNTRFIDNIFVNQLEKNYQFDTYMSEKKMSWADHSDLVKELFDEVELSPFYFEYMNAEQNDFAADKDIWRKIYKKIILQSQYLDEIIENESVYWIDNIEVVVSFVIKTIKKFEISNGDEQELMPMFKDEEDAEFARKLLRSALTKDATLRDIIDKNTQNWELERIAFMDIIIMEVALVELMEFPTIPVNVTLNEYIEIAKAYSTEKSAPFINGVLDNIVGQLKKENKLIKVVNFK